jgi:hypothetical protein
MDYMKNFVENFLPSSVGKCTIKNYGDALKSLQKIIGKNLTDIANTDAQTWVVEQRKSGINRRSK